MTVASGTATRPELVTLHDACYNLAIMLRQNKDGTGKPDGTNTRFTAAQIDTQIAAVSAAITAVNA